MARSKKAQEAADFAMSVNVPISSAGLGVDMVEVARMRKILDRTPSFEEKSFSEAERLYCNSKSNAAMRFAAHFAAKEAVLKSLGCGFSQGVGLRDVEVSHEDGGRPVAILHGRAAELASDQDVKEIALSISHTDTDAIACAIAIKEGSVAQVRKKEDSAAELSKRFKEARGMLDDIASPVAEDHKEGQ